MVDMASILDILGGELYLRVSHDPTGEGLGVIRAVGEHIDYARVAGLGELAPVLLLNLFTFHDSEKVREFAAQVEAQMSQLLQELGAEAATDVESNVALVAANVDKPRKEHVVRACLQLVKTILENGAGGVAPAALLALLGQSTSEGVSILGPYRGQGVVAPAASPVVVASAVPEYRSIG